MTEDNTEEHRGQYLQNNPLYNMFADPIFKEIFVSIAEDGEHTSHIDSILQGYPEHGEILEECGVLFGDSTSGFELNQHSPLVKVLTEPHAERLVRNPEAVGLLTVYMHKTYRTLVPNETLIYLTGFSEETVQDANELLEKFGHIEGRIVLDGQSGKPQNAEEWVTRYNAISELLEDNRESVPTDKLRSAVGRVDSSSEEEVIVIPKSSFEETVQMVAENVANTGIETIETSDNGLGNLEEGTTGHSIVKSNEMVKNLLRFEMGCHQSVSKILDVTEKEE